MAIYDGSVIVEVGPNSAPVVLCRDCKRIAEKAYGAQNKVQLAYILQCPACLKTLGEWTTPDERDHEIAEILRKFRG